MAHVVTHAVVDTGAFIRNAPLQDLASNLYTVKEVVDEIKDKATLQRLQVLPYDLTFREPAAECIKAVTDFTKLTGDYPSLSATDLRVMALAYQLEREYVGMSHIKTVPNRKIEFTTIGRSLEKPTDIAGFYLGPSGTTKATCGDASCSSSGEKSTLGAGRSDIGSGVCDKPEENCTQQPTSENNGQQPTSVTGGALADSAAAPVDLESQGLVGGSETCHDRAPETDGARMEHAEFEGRGPDHPSAGDVGSDDDDVEEVAGDQDDDDGDDGNEDDNEGWITPSNLKQVQAEMRSQGGSAARADTVAVGCVTTDFAMQNVLIQMGLNVVSCDGLIIKRARSYVLRCAACFKITTNMTKQFCHHCGNKMLQKVAATVNEDGSISYYLSRRKPITTRGLKFSLPMPRGGKHAVNPQLAEDQPAPQQRASKMAQHRGKDVFADDYVAQASPFAVHDVVSRAARLGIRSGKGQEQPEQQYWNRKNPNEARRHGRRK